MTNEMPRQMKWLCVNLLYCRLRGKENTVIRDYVLPDYTHIKRGHIRSEEEIGTKAKGSEQVKTYY